MRKNRTEMAWMTSLGLTALKYKSWCRAKLLAAPSSEKASSLEFWLTTSSSRRIRFGCQTDINQVTGPTEASRAFRCDHPATPSPPGMTYDRTNDAMQFVSHVVGPVDVMWLNLWKSRWHCCDVAHEFQIRHWFSHCYFIWWLCYFMWRLCYFIQGLCAISYDGCAFANDVMHTNYQ